MDNHESGKRRQASAYEQIFGKAMLPLYEWVRGRPTISYMQDSERFQWMSKDDIERYQNERLVELVRHCWENVPFYRSVWQANGLEISSIQTRDDLVRLPVLTKELIKSNYDSLIAGGYRGKTLSKTTGGSTGIPLKFEYTRDAYCRRVAAMWRGYRWAGSIPGRRTAYIWGVDPVGSGSLSKLKDRLFHAVFGRVFLNCFELTDANIASFIEAINRHRPKVIVAYVTPVLDLARYVLANKISVHSPDSIVTGAEALHESQRHEIEEAFRTRVFNTYGSREFMLLAAECDRHNGLHISADNVILETVDDANGPVIDEPGKLLVTDLHNYGMPFIRYEIGDLATKSSRACECGRSLPLLDQVDGRILDQIFTISGARIPGQFFPHLIKDFAAVRRFQVIQERKDKLLILLVADEFRFESEQRATLERKVREVLGRGTSLEIRVVDEIPTNAAGKHRVTVSQLQP